MSDVRHVLVLPDRDSAEECAQVLAERLGLADEPRPVRGALAGEDDAEDAQWLLVLENADGDSWGTGVLDEIDTLAASYEGWLERD